MQTSKSKTYIVTGGCGFIGSGFVRKLATQGHPVLVLDALTYAGHKENLEGLTGPGSWELIQGSITDGPLIARLLQDNQVDYLINFAAESHVDRSISGPKVFIETNIIGTFTLLNA